ncbi:MAG: Uma2 family endonuclease [Thermomicrobiales bacterium]
MSVPVAGKHYTLAEYHHLGDIGVLGEDDRVELIEGEIVTLETITGHHMWGVIHFTHGMSELPGKTWLVSVQNPVHLFGDTEPQPDIALLRPEAARPVIPSAVDVYLIVEVSDTTLAYDCGRKRQLYARADIPEYWIMDIAGRRILQHTDLAMGDYQSVTPFVPGDAIDSPVLPAIRLSVAALFA